jgi:hypothetical protein
VKNYRHQPHVAQENNPYLGVGQEATGDRFIGRAGPIHEVQQVWQKPGRPSNLRVLGHHRVGKTSLVRRALATSTGPTNMLALWINVGHHATGVDLFRSMSRQALERVGGTDSHTLVGSAEKKLHAINAAIQATADWYDLSEATKKFLSTLSETGYNVLVVLDEFDRAATTLTSLAEFQTLRTLASEPQYSLGLITISRQHIESIEIDAMGGSILGGVVPVAQYVGMFTDTETDLILARAAEVNVGLAAIRPEIVERAGNHPFLLELLCSRLVEHFRTTGELDVQAAYNAEIHAFETQFRHLVRHINTETSGRGLPLLQQIAAGRAQVGYPSDIQRLRLMGVIHGGATDLRLFSAEFGRYVLTEGQGS